jgi:hypothetical protein
MNKSELLATLRSERKVLDELLDAVGTDRMAEPGVSGSYSAKDVIAHVTAYQRALVTWLGEARAGRVYVDPVLDQPDLDARNAAVHTANKDRSAEDIVRTFHETLDELEQCVDILTDGELNDAGAAAWFVEPRWHRRQELWQCIADDSCEHQQEHVPDFERWLAEHPR